MLLYIGLHVPDLSALTFVMGVWVSQDICMRDVLRFKTLFLCRSHRKCALHLSVLFVMARYPIKLNVLATVG